MACVKSVIINIVLLTVAYLAVAHGAKRRGGGFRLANTRDCTRTEGMSMFKCQFTLWKKHKDTFMAMIGQPACNMEAIPCDDLIVARDCLLGLTSSGKVSQKCGAQWAVHSNAQFENQRIPCKVDVMTERCERLIAQKIEAQERLRIALEQAQQRQQQQQQPQQWQGK